MIKMPYEMIVEKLIEKSNLSKSDIEGKVDLKLKQLSGLISKEGAAHIVANELGIKLFEQKEGKLKIKNILAGMRNVEAAGKVQRIFDIREFKTEKGSGKVGSFVLSDETGSIRIVLWGDQTAKLSKLKEDIIVKIIGGYVKENQGRVEVHTNDRSKIMINPEGVSIGEIKQTTVARKKIKELTGNDDNVELLGTIVQAFDPRFFEVCPKCNGRAKPQEGNYVCAKHGEVKPNYSYVMNVALDDGTDNIRIVFFRNQLENLLNKNPKEMLEYKAAPEKFEEVKSQLLGNIIKVAGRVTKNEMFDRLEFVSNLVNPNPDPKEEVKRLQNQ